MKEIKAYTPEWWSWSKEKREQAFRDAFKDGVAKWAASHKNCDIEACLTCKELNDKS